MLRRVMALLAAWSVCVLAALGWGLRREWPDFVHDSYGFPFPWAIHTLVTFTGPADFWVVNINALILNLVFWHGVLGAALALLLRKRR
ncbi:MAG: hypothetical protein QXO86_04285 [Nitrososphaerota archaeon]